MDKAQPDLTSKVYKVVIDRFLKEKHIGFVCTACSTFFPDHSKVNRTKHVQLISIKQFILDQKINKEEDLKVWLNTKAKEKHPRLNEDHCFARELQLESKIKDLEKEVQRLTKLANPEVKFFKKDKV
jgi:hypothetical protein